MAAFTTIAIAAGAALTAAGGASNAIKGAKRAKDAQKALDNFKRQELKNVTEGMRVSTYGAELQTQEAQRRFATSVDALRSGGVRGLVGGLGQQEQLQQVQQQQIAADLDRQQVNIDQMAAQDEQRIQGMQEKRESGAIAGLGSEIAAGRAQQTQGFSSIAQAGTSLLSAGMGSMGNGAAAGSQAIESAGKSAMNTGMQAMGALSAPISANLTQPKASSFQMPSSFTATNPYAPKDYSAGFGDEQRTFFNLGNQ